VTQLIKNVQVEALSFHELARKSADLFFTEPRNKFELKNYDVQNQYMFSCIWVDKNSCLKKTKKHALSRRLRVVYTVKFKRADIQV
jgi:hypothetical protein